MNLGFLKAIRQNHAIEHATIAILLRRFGTRTALVGGSTPSGFYIYGDLPTEAVKEAAIEGLTQLQRGEVDLAVSPFCGTNIVVAGILTGLSSAIAIGRKNRLLRLPNVIFAAIAAAFLAQPLGRLVQKHLTTDTELQHVAIGRVTRSKSGKWTLHKIETIR